MPIRFHPKVGQILMCDFSGFKVPEIVKNRPVIIITPAYKGRSGLVTVTPLSTKEPDEIQPYHYCLPRQCMPKIAKFQNNDSWVKGDLLYTVGFHRLNLIRLPRCSQTGKRMYFKQRINKESMREINQAILHGLNFSHLTKHLET